MTPHLSIVIPTYNEAENVPVLHEWLARAAGQLPAWEWEFVFVDDGSRDGTWEALRAPEREVRDTTEILIVRRKVCKTMHSHRREDQGVIRQQVIAPAQVNSQDKFAPSHGQDLDMGLQELGDVRSRDRAGGQMLRVASEQIQGGFRGRQVPALDGFSQRQAMGDFAQDHRGSDRADLAGGGTTEQHGAAWTPFKDVVHQHIGVQEDRPAGWEPLEHLRVPEAESVGGGQFQHDPSWDLDEMSRGFDLVERRAPSQDDRRVVGKRQFTVQLERSVSVHGFDGLGRHHPLLAHYSTMRVERRQTGEGM